MYLIKNMSDLHLRGALEVMTVFLNLCLIRFIVNTL